MFLELFLYYRWAEEDSLPQKLAISVGRNFRVLEPIAWGLQNFLKPFKGAVYQYLV